MATRTMTATTFWSAETAVQSRLSSGHESTAWMNPPVTALAVPTVSSTNPQKMPQCISAARGSLNIRVWMSAYSTTPHNRAGMLPETVDGPATAKTRRWRAITSAKITAAP